jgi:LacI family transcriptional regulator
MAKKKITIIDIAQRLNLAKSTVSRALADNPRISEETRNAVKKLARKLDYEPNNLAISFFKKKSFTIGVIVPEIVNHFFSAAIDGIEDIAHKAGYRVLICKSDESYEREMTNLSALISHPVDGLLISISKETTDVEHLMSVVKKEIPLVLFDRITDKLNVNKVTVDDESGAFTAVEHLIEAGYKRIAHLAGPSTLLLGKSRKRGYLRAMKKNDMTIYKELILEGGMDIRSGYENMKILLDRKKIPDAIFTANDQIAIGAMKAIKEKKLRIPADIGIVGFSNEPLTTLTEPQLTTMNQPAFTIGQTACTLLVEMMDMPYNKRKIKKVVLKTTLVKREST